MRWIGGDLNSPPASSFATPSPSSQPSAARDLTLLLLGLALLYFPLMGLRPLSNPDEGRYVEIGREMATTGDWISPHLNGLLYFEKPPLFYWLEAGAVSAGGMNLWALRFWPALLALLGCAAVYGTGRALWGRPTGWWAAWIQGTSLLYYGLGQIIILDMAVSVFITWALCAFALAVRAPPGARRRGLCYAFYASMALALLTKGLIGVLIPGAIIFLWMLALNRWRELRHASLLPGLALLLVIALPWHLAAAYANPPSGGWSHFFSKDWAGQGFVWYYFWHEHVLRYIDPATSERVQPRWFFFAVLPAGFLPWIAFLPQTLRYANTGGWARLKSEPETVLLFLWTLFPLLFFSASSSKLIPYILPSLPPLALLTGRFLAEALREPGAPRLKWPLRVLGTLGLGLGVALPFAVFAYNIHLADPIMGSYITFLHVFAATLFNFLAGLLVAGGAAILYFTFRPRPDSRTALKVLVAVLAIFLFFFSPLASVVQRPSTQPLAAWLKPRLHPGDRVFTLWDYGPFSDLPPYLGQTIGVAGQIPEEQKFGAMLETAAAADRYPGLAAYLALKTNPPPTHEVLNATLMNPFVDILRGPQRVFVVVAAQQYPAFRKRYPDAPAYLWWRNGDFVLFSNQPAPEPIEGNTLE
jgi:4-amino-4-deoxy-L-arabinose transferase-like glycosyltransferase